MSQTSQAFRIAGRGRIDASSTLSFRFNDRRYQGHPGDTLASALLANGVHLVGRSFKYHRPRGIMTAGPEEPNALVQVTPDDAGATDPNFRATQVELYEGLSAASQNCWPSVERDVGVVNDVLARFFPAGFYYKTFMGPKIGRGDTWQLFEPIIRRAAGLGQCPTGPDPASYDHCYAHCDVLVVGSGPAGLAAALAAGRGGARVILCEDGAALGGSLLSEGPDGVVIDGGSGADWADRARAELESLVDVTVLPRTQCFGYYHHNWLGLLQRLTDHMAPGTAPAGLPRQRFWKVRAKQVVLATGAIERPLVFDGNDRPGVMLAGAGRSYLNRYGVAVGRSVAVATNNDSAYRTALDLAGAGIDVRAIVDLRPDPRGPLVQQARAAGLEVLTGHGISQTHGRARIGLAHARPLTADGTGFVGSAREELGVDALLVSGGWNPVVHLFSQSKGTLRWDADLTSFVPGRWFQQGRAAGACNGTTTIAAALAEGWRAGAAAAADTGFGSDTTPLPADLARVDEPQVAGEIRPIWMLPHDRPAADVAAFVDFQNDVKAKDLKLALAEGYESVEHVKRYTTTGMGTDQGKLGNVNALGIVAQTLGAELPEVGVTTFRPPYTPVTFGAIAGRNIKGLYAPIRRTPMHPWHEAKGAVFENVGQWKRPWYYLRPGEDMHAAVQRETKAVRDGVGIFDGTTLGKIDIQGRDAAEFLNRVYTNAWSKLGVGRCRYGLMLGEDGMVKDDGVTTRLGENHFHMTTTTGGAATIMGWLEEWLQTEWPTLQVQCTSVTEQWAVIALAGPKARDVAAAVVGGVDFSREAFPFMSMRAGTMRLGGADGAAVEVPVRVFRISFSGEIGYEINVPASYGLAAWEACWAAGQPHGITPYGTETMHVLRAEKGFIIVGQETDGTITPHDLRMDWIVSKQKPDFIGKRSLTRRDMLKPGRKQLVGLQTGDPAVVLEEGAQIVAGATLSDGPVPMLGHVTSSYFSPNLGRSIALALVQDGGARLGETLYVAMPDRTLPVTLVEPVFIDPEGERLHA